MYKPYCYNHPYSVTAYQMIKNGKYSKPFRRFEEEMFKRPECRLMELPSFLLKPVQRICKYPLLIKVTRKSNLVFSVIDLCSRKFSKQRPQSTTTTTI